MWEGVWGERGKERVKEKEEGKGGEGRGGKERRKEDEGEFARYDI